MTAIGIVIIAALVLLVILLKEGVAGLTAFLKSLGDLLLKAGQALAAPIKPASEAVVKIAEERQSRWQAKVLGLAAAATPPQRRPQLPDSTPIRGNPDIPMANGQSRVAAAGERGTVSRGGEPTTAQVEQEVS